MTGARGPKSNPNAVRRNKGKAATHLSAETPDVPELVGDYLPQTVAWWKAWTHGPQVEHFAATDWQTLLRLVPLVDAFYLAPTASLAAEIRQTEAKLGATAADRDRLGWKIDTPNPEGDASGARAGGSRSRPDPRKGDDA